jgi:pimeloyl-ACP methyl ester carboxylesterase
MDPPPDKEFPATMEAPDIMSHGSRLNAVLFMASGKEAHPTILLMHGFPGNEKNWTSPMPCAAQAGMC